MNKPDYLSGIPEDKQAVIDAFYRFIEQRPGISPEDYNGYIHGYYADRYIATRDRKWALEQLAQFAWRSFDRECLARVMAYSYSGRLMFDNSGSLVYTSGQMEATEYRAAAATVLENYCETYWREDENADTK